MIQYCTYLSKYIGILGAMAITIEYGVPRIIGDKFALILIDFSGVIKSNKIDAFIAKIAIYWEKKYNQLFGNNFFSKRQFIISISLVLIYCSLFTFTEKFILGFNSNIFKQLRYWFLPSLIADICSINFTRFLLRKIAAKPRKYLIYLLFDFLIVIVCYYFSYLIAIFDLFRHCRSLGISRIILHPFYMILLAVENFPMPIALDIILVIIMALTTVIPTILHLTFVLLFITARYLIPVVTFTTNSLIERIISFDRHPLAVAVIVIGIYLLPIVLLYILKLKYIGP